MTTPSQGAKGAPKNAVPPSEFPETFSIIGWDPIGFELEPGTIIQVGVLLPDGMSKRGDRKEEFTVYTLPFVDRLRKEHAALLEAAVAEAVTKLPPIAESDKKVTPEELPVRYLTKHEVAGECQRRYGRNHSTDDAIMLASNYSYSAAEKKRSAEIESLKRDIRELKELEDIEIVLARTKTEEYFRTAAELQQVKAERDRYKRVLQRARRWCDRGAVERPADGEPTLGEIIDEALAPKAGEK